MDYSTHFISKLEESGLTVEDAHTLRFCDLSEDETAELHSMLDKKPSLRIPYFNPDGTQLKDRPKFEDCPPYFRIRYLNKPRVGFYKHVDKKKGGYRQLPGTLPAAYYPLNFSALPWTDLVADPKHPIILTEGELKAAKACKEGYPCIGIGGVNSFHARKHGYDLIPSLALINFVGRTVYICYDSDYRTNELVLAGIKDLSNTLERYGAITHFVALPSELGDDTKTGLDDFFVKHGSERGCHIFNSLLQEAVPISTTEPLFNLNKRYCYVSHPPSIIDKKTKQPLKKDHFKDATCNIYYLAPQIKKDGEIKYKPTSVSTPWMGWPLRNQADTLVYEPGNAEKFDFIRRGSELVGYNTWNGWGCVPSKGDVTHFLEFIDYLFQYADTSHRHWFLQWLAYPLQHPGKKLFTSVILQGVLHGSGKTMLGYTMGEIYGDNFIEIDQEMLENSFNEWCIDKSFILADELTGSKQRFFADKLKKLITQRDVSINRKNINLYTITDHMNYLFTSNHPDAFYLEDTDRRFFVVNVPSHLLPEAFYKTYEVKYLRGGCEISHVFDYLLKYDLSGFNPSGHAPTTQAKDNMTQLGLSDLGLFIRGLVTNPEQYAKGCCDLMTAKDILTVYKQSDDVSDNSKRSITLNGISRELNAANVLKVNSDNRVHYNGAKIRLYIINNTDKWLAASHSEVVEYLANFKSNLKKHVKY